MGAKSANEGDGDAPSQADAESDTFDALLRSAFRSTQALGTSTRATPPSLGSALCGGRLSLLRRLGEGGMGVVYEAFDREREARVACKTLNCIDAGRLYQLKNEFRSLADVMHPNVVRLYELFIDDRVCCFTMELVEGQPFDAWARPAGVLNAERLRSALSQLFSGVSAIHDAGKLHRDLKPSNVLVTPHGRVVVLDFGLVVDPELGGVGQTLADDRVSGTPAYMAPEQAAGKSATWASDYYAIGSMLFEALTGRLPFEGRIGEILAAKQRETPVGASELAPDVPEDLARLCSQLLAREPAQRPDRQALSAVVSGPHAAPHIPTGQRSTAPAQGAALELLGRESELLALREAYRAARAGETVVVFVSGESGVGKSALLEAFLNEQRSRGEALVFSGRCHERENVPYKAFDALIDAISRHLRKLPAHEAAALMPREVFALSRIFPVLERVPVIAASPKRDVPDPHDLKRRAFDAFAELIARMRDRAPLILMVDDLHWLDEDSLRFMRALFVQPEPAPVLLLCAHRSEDVQRNALLQSVRQAASDNPALDARTLDVGPLSHQALLELVKRLLPSGIAAERADVLAREAHGSPFFAGELARATMLCESGDAQLALARALTLHVSALPTEAQQLLSVVALAGQPLSPVLAIKAAGLAEGHAHVDHLRSEQLVRVSLGRSGERTIECYHDKIREQVAASLNAARSRELAHALSETLLAEADADAELLARLLQLAGRTSEAAEHEARAADRAFATLAFDRAARLYLSAIERGNFAGSELGRLRTQRARALAHAGYGERAATAFLDAARAAPPAVVHGLERSAGEQYLLCGDLERGRVLLARALRHFGIPFPRSLSGALASVAWSRTRMRLSNLRLVESVRVDAQTLQELEVLRTVTHGLIRSDQLRAADFCARWVLRALDAGNALELARALAWELLLSSMMGADDERVTELATLCERFSVQTDDRLSLFMLAFARGYHRLMTLNQPVQALPELDRALELLNANPSATTSYDRAWVQSFRATSLHLCGRIAMAGEIAFAQLEDALARGDRTVGAMFTNLVCYAHLAGDRPEQAAKAVEAAELHLRSGEHHLQHFLWLSGQPLPALYQGHARRAWYAAERQREWFLSSFAGRFMHPGMLEHMA
ncbi:MAG TPA: AAA family ATPase, partial [Polyangiaceae bacterium]|nr:AAA family ATPase [Polyangiaceae bacterium]